MLPPSRRDVRVGVAFKRKPQTHRARDGDGVSGVEIRAALQPSHAVRAVEVIDDLAEIQLVHRPLRHTVILPVNTNPDRMPGLECDAGRAGVEGPGQKRVQAGCLDPRLLDPAEAFPRPARSGPLPRAPDADYRARSAPVWLSA